MENGFFLLIIYFLTGTFVACTLPSFTPKNLLETQFSKYEPRASPRATKNGEDVASIGDHHGSLSTLDNTNMAIENLLKMSPLSTSKPFSKKMTHSSKSSKKKVKKKKKIGPKKHKSSQKELQSSVKPTIPWKHQYLNGVTASQSEIMRSNRKDVTESRNTTSQLSTTNLPIEENISPAVISTSPSNLKTSSSAKNTKLSTEKLRLSKAVDHVTQTKQNMEGIKMNSTQSSNLPFIEIDGRPYLVETEEKVSFYEASHICRRLRMDLLSIETEDEEDALISYMSENRISNVWTSGTDLAEEGQFFWMSTGEAFEFTAWGQNQPNNYGSNEHCVQLVHSPLVSEEYAWEDTICDLPSHFICEMRPCSDFCIKSE